MQLAHSGSGSERSVTREKCYSWYYSCMITLRYSPFSLGHLILQCPLPWTTRSIFIVFPDYSKAPTACGSDWPHTSLKQGQGTESLPKRKGSALHTFFFFFWCEGMTVQWSFTMHKSASTWSNSQLYSELGKRISHCYLQPLASHVISQSLQVEKLPHCSF